MALDIYTKTHLRLHNDPEKLTKHYNELLDWHPPSKIAALLRIALIGVYEEQATAAKNPKAEAKLKAEAMVKVLFVDLQSSFPLKNLSGYTLLRIGDYLRKQTDSPKDALPYYEEGLTRPDVFYKTSSHFGIAAILGRKQSSKIDKQKALKSLDYIINHEPKRQTRICALRRKTIVLARLDAWPQVSTHAERFLVWGQRDSEIAFLLAQSYERCGKRDDAIGAYTHVLSDYIGVVHHSAPAVGNLIRLLNERDRAHDKQLAYDLGRQYHQKIKELVPEMTAAEKQSFNKVGGLLNELEADPAVRMVVE